MEGKERIGKDCFFSGPFDASLGGWTETGHPPDWNISPDGKSNISMRLRQPRKLQILQVCKKRVDGKFLVNNELDEERKENEDRQD
jgi:hypothetical protein